MQVVVRLVLGLVSAFVLGWIGCLPTFIGFQGLGSTVPRSFAAAHYAWWTTVWTLAGAIGAAVAGRGIRRGLVTAVAFGAGGCLSAAILLTAVELNAGAYSKVRGQGGFWDWNSDAWRLAALVSPAVAGGLTLSVGTRRARSSGSS